METIVQFVPLKWLTHAVWAKGMVCFAYYVRVTY